MDFLQDISNGIRDFFSSIGNFFSGGGFHASGASMIAPAPVGMAYEHDFSGPQMRPPSVDHHHGPHAGPHIGQNFGMAASHYGQYPYNSPAFSAQRDAMRIENAATRLGQTVLNAPFRLADGVVRGVSREISREITRESAALNRQIRHDVMHGFGFGHGRR